MQPRLTDFPALKPYLSQLIAGNKPVAEIFFDADEQLSPWQSKLGGTPYLPLNMEYPRHPEGYPLALFIQINFAEMPPLPDFPHEGILQIFLDGKADDLGFFSPAEHRCVRFFREIQHDPNVLQSSFPDVPLEEYFPVQTAHAIRYRAALHVGFGDVSPYEIHGKDGRLYNQDDEACTALSQYRASLQPSPNHISGYAAFNQYDPRYEVDVFDESFREYVVLLQLNGAQCEALGGHYVCYNLFIHPDDLRKRDFSKLYFNLDSD